MSADTRQIAGTLRRCTLLKDLDVTELTTLAQLVEVRTFDPRQQLYAPAEAGNSLFVIAQGKVEFFVNLEDRARVIGVRAAVDSFGELGLLLPGARMVGARTEQEAVLYELTHGQLAMLERSDPRLAVKILSAVRERAAGALGEVRPMIGALFAETLKRTQKR